MNTAYNEKTFNEFQRLQKCVADLIRCRGYFDASAKLIFFFPVTDPVDVFIS